MKAPDFWFQPPGVAAHLLAPFGWAYDLGGRLRRLRAVPLTPAAPVFCIGNLVAGGAGKTPVALAVTDWLNRRGLVSHLLTRGYGGRLRGPVRVLPGHHDATQVGDEALLLAEAAPTWVARDRAAGALAACAAGAGAVVLDDGFQNPALHYRLALLVVDGAVGFGNGRVIPAGPLRELVARGLSRASALVILGDDRAGIAAMIATRAALTGLTLPLIQARLIPDPVVAAALRGQRLFAFAGIGRPAKFFETCRDLGADLIGTAAFPDHHRYRPEELAALLAHARALDARPVTTAKDAVRLPAAVRNQCQILPVTVAWQDPGQVNDLLTAAVEHGIPRHV
jgi:tetraacyldisaccharide 4'-kinase